MSIEFLSFVFFKLTIFFLLSIVVYKIVKNYLTASLYEEILKIEKHKKDLVDESDLLNESKNVLEKKHIDQKKGFVYLEEKVKIWHDDQIKDVKFKSLEYQKRIEKFSIKREEQFSNLKMQKIQEIVLPKSMDLARKDMEEKFAGQKGFSLLEELITKIEPKG